MLTYCQENGLLDNILIQDDDPSVARLPPTSSEEEWRLTAIKIVPGEIFVDHWYTVELQLMVIQEWHLV